MSPQPVMFTACITALTVKCQPLLCRSQCLSSILCILYTYVHKSVFVLCKGDTATTNIVLLAHLYYICPGMVSDLVCSCFFEGCVWGGQVLKELHLNSLYSCPTIYCNVSAVTHATVHTCSLSIQLGFLVSQDAYKPRI